MTADRRRLKLVPPIELKPITILVGKNSSGKSSFLRAFPLLPQSLMTRTSSPILWYGDFVDFGSFDISVSNNATDQPISFSFGIDKLRIEDSSVFRFGYFPGLEGENTYRGIHLDVSIRQLGDKTIISRIFLTIDDPKSTYEIFVAPESKIISLKFDDKEISELLKPISFQITTGSLFVMSRCLLNIAKRSLLRLMLSCVGLASKHAAG
jgi:AAA15 family ATPase/GTPase